MPLPPTIAPTRRLVLGGLVAAGAGALLPGPSAASGSAESVRPFRVSVPEEDLIDLRRRIAGTRWPLRETAPGDSQGVPLDRLRALAAYWADGYDWRRAEAKLNALPMFLTDIDGLDIHFIHVRSRHDGALPMIMTHGWPGSVLELSEGHRSAHRSDGATAGRAEDAFRSCRSLDPRIRLLRQAGYARLGIRPDRPSLGGADGTAGLRPLRLAGRRLRFRDLTANGAAEGARVSLGIHLNMPGTVPPEIAAILIAGGPAPAGLSGAEQSRLRCARNLLPGQLRLCGDDGHAPADHRLCPGRLAGRTRRLDLR